MSLPLAGRCIVIARPLAQADELARLLEAEGAEALRFPILDIQPLADTRHLDALTARLTDYDLAFFVSPNAVRHAMRALHPAWPASLRVATVGPGSARALREAGFDEVIAPATQFDSEGVLALPEFSETAVRGRRILVLRGEGGREVLADTLRARGAQVDTVACYRRSGAALDATPLLQRLRAGKLHGIVITSSEAVVHLGTLPGGQALLEQGTLFVSHARIAANARAAGAGRVILTAAGDAGIVAGIVQHAAGE